MSVDFLERKPELWRPDDSEWMAARTEQWRFIERRLRGDTRRIERSTWKTLKRYFLFGDVSIPNYDLTSPTVYQIVLTLWLYPTLPRLENVSFDSKGARIMGDLDMRIENFSLELYDSWASSIDSREDNPGYGVLGGRDELVARFLNPKLDFRERIALSRNTSMAGCLKPMSLIRMVWNATNSETFDWTADRSKYGYEKKVYVPGLMGLHLWDHLDYALGTYPYGVYRTYFIDNPHKISEPEYQASISRVDWNMNRCVTRILTFHDRLSSQEIDNRPVARDLVERLIGRYEKRDFSEKMLAYWDKAKVGIGNAGGS